MSDSDTNAIAQQSSQMTTQSVTYASAAAVSRENHQASSVMQLQQLSTPTNEQGAVDLVASWASQWQWQISVSKCSTVGRSSINAS